jgi:glyoxylase I family protein
VGGPGAKLRVVNCSVEHIGLAAREPRELADWYCRVLGGDLVFQTDGNTPAFFVKLGGGLIMELYAAEKSLDDTGYNRLAGWRHLALRVDSLDSARTSLTVRGVKFDEPPKPAGGGGQVLFFQDPEGNLLHLVERFRNSTFAP